MSVSSSAKIAASAKEEQAETLAHKAGSSWAGSQPEDPNSPATPSLAYLRASQRWFLPQALMGGTPYVRKHCHELIPQFNNEPDEAYQERVRMTTLTNVYKKTVKRLASTPFADPIIFDTDADDAIVGNDRGEEGWIYDMDNQGTALPAFARDSLEDILNFGLCHILPNFPPNPKEDMSKEERKALKLRPYFSLISPLNLFAWKTGTIGGKLIIRELRWYEKVTEPDGEFGEKEHHQIRVTTETEVTIYRQIVTAEGKKQWRIHGEPEQLRLPANMVGLPLVTIYANRDGGQLTAEPPLEDLAELNHKHLRSDSDMQRIIHVTCTPFLEAIGFSEADMKGAKIGPGSMARSSNTDAHIKWVEHSGQQIAALQANLDKIKDDMDSMSLRMLTKGQLGGITATATAVNTAEETSELQEIVANLAQGLDRCFEHGKAWAGDPNAYEIITGTTINADFGLVVRGPEDVRNLLDVHARSAITHKTLLSELQLHGLLSERVDIDEEVKAAKAEAREQDDLDFPQPTPFQPKAVDQ